MSIYDTDYQHYFGGGNPTFMESLDIEDRLRSQAGRGQAQASGALGGGVQQQAQNQSTQSSQAGNYFNDPALVASLSHALGGTAQQSAQGYNSFVNNPTAHPAFQNALSGLLQALHPQEQAGLRNTMDAARAAGNTSSSAAGQALGSYNAGVNRNQMETASKLLTTMFPQIAQAMFAPMSQTNGLIDALKMNQQSSQGQSTGSSTGYFDPLRMAMAQLSASRGGGGGGSGGGGRSGSSLMSQGSMPTTSPWSSFYGSPSSPANYGQQGVISGDLSGMSDPFGMNGGFGAGAGLIGPGETSNQPSATNYGNDYDNGFGA